MDYFDKALELDPNDYAALHNKGLFSGNLKNLEKQLKKLMSFSIKH